MWRLNSDRLIAYKDPRRYMQLAAVKIHLSLISEPPHLQSSLMSVVLPYPNSA